MQFILIGAVRYNVPRICAARISPRGPSLALRAIHLVPRLRRPKLDVAVRQPKCGKVLYHAVVKILCRSPFPAYAVYHLHPSYDYKGNGCSKRVETVGVYPLVRPRGVSALPAEVQRKTLRPERANPPAAVRVPQSAGAEKRLPPGRGEHAHAVRAPQSAGAEKAVVQRLRYSTFSSSFCT